jgi:CubicO group peptidase (beta-lactamase class C family)
MTAFDRPDESRSRRTWSAPVNNGQSADLRGTHALVHERFTVLRSEPMIQGELGQHPLKRMREAAAATVIPDTPAGRRLRAFLAFAGTALPDRVAAFLNTHYVAAYAARDPLERRIAAYMDWTARGGFEFLEVQHSDALRIETTVRQPFTDEHWQLAVEVESQPPHRIDALVLGRSPLPVLRRPLTDGEAADGFLDYASRLAAADLFSGVVLIARHGRILGQAAHGLANRDFDVPNTMTTRFNVCSLSKSWTAVAICQLVEEGRLSLDEPLATFLDYPDAATASAIRIKHLLSHTSGLDSYFTPEFDRKSRRDVRALDDFLALSKHQRSAFAPGTGWKYSNTGMIVLGKVIELITGRDYFEHIEDRVLTQAGMTGASYPELDFVNKNTAVGYGKVWSRNGMRIANSLFEGVVRGGPAGGAYGTAADLFRFAEALKHGRLVSPAMVELMTTAKPELGAPDYGYGFAVHPQRALYGHSGGIAGASANLDMTIDPAGWVVVVLANDLGMRALALKARQLIGVTVPEAEEGRSYLPRAGKTAR